METIAHYRVGMDSQCLSYLIDTMARATEPLGLLAEEKKSLIRIYFYMPDTLYLTATVKEECARIRNVNWRELHESFSQMIFDEVTPTNTSEVKVFTAAYANYHRDNEDCCILAEAEVGGLDVLLTYDKAFLSHLKEKSQKVSLLTPSELISKLGIQKGDQPYKIPHSTNPLSKQDWWRL